ncbi:MAG TPA: tetratricopeptide repeat protein [Saprospiraceae bacterium]|nr:tetratricopeptide repeat protein [Saprospiraceae bacterium]
MSKDPSAEIYEKLRDYCAAHEMELTEDNLNEVLKLALSEEEYEQIFLPDTIGGQVERLSMRADLLTEQGKFAEAILLYQEGLELIPEPKSTYEATLWFLVAIGDAYWYLKEWEHAIPYFERSLEVLGGKENPFVWLRLGQLHYEMGDLVAAQRELNKGLEIEGEDLFEGEEFKYLQLAKTSLN